MQWLDWLLLFAPLVVVIAVSIYTQRYLKSVSDFLSAGRLGGRYLLAVSKGEIGAGAVAFAAAFEVFSKSGLALGWWGRISVPVMVILSITGFVIYRYRETRALTLAQFFEIRYSKRFRLFTGILGFGAGLVNFGVIPAIGARFMTHFLGLPPTVHLFSYEISTYILLMVFLLGTTLFVTATGGFSTLMIANCMEGMISQVLYLFLIFGLLSMFKWTEIAHVLADQPRGHSLINPFDSLSTADFNIWYALMGIVISVYSTMAWQNQSAFNSAALSAHESRMSSIIGHWRIMGKAEVTMLLGACAMTFLYHPDFAAQSAPAHAEIARIASEQIQTQMTIPIALEHMLPVGLKGAFCVVLIMGIIGGDGNHLHSWGSLFIQDVIVPLRKKPFTPHEHIQLLRWSMVFVAAFAFCFGCIFRQTDYIVMWWTVTMSLYVGGAGAAIIGGLYWKKGTTAGAWTGMLTGSILSVAGIVARARDPHFPLNYQQISFFVMLLAVGLYVLVSLLTCREDFNMDRMLHRGAYSSEKTAPVAEDRSMKGLLLKVIGIDKNFTKSDAWVSGLYFGWTMFWFVVFVVITVWNCFWSWPLSWWVDYQFVTSILIAVVMSVVTTVWFTWGGVHDVINFFRHLKVQKVNAADNGMVVDHQNLDDVAPPKPTSPEKVLMSEKKG